MTKCQNFIKIRTKTWIYGNVVTLLLNFAYGFAGVGSRNSFPYNLFGDFVPFQMFTAYFNDTLI